MVGKDTFTLIAALLAAVTSTGNVYFSYLSASSIERERWEKEREDETKKALRTAVEAFAQELATAIQRATWLLWKAENNPSGFSDQDLKVYDQEMKTVLPRLLVTRVLVAAHDMGIYEQLSEIAAHFYELDSKIALADQSFRVSPDQGITQLRKLHYQAQKLHHQLGHRLAQIFSTPEARVAP
jgi:hypothetical protein